MSDSRYLVKCQYVDPLDTETTAHLILQAAIEYADRECRWEKTSTVEVIDDSTGETMYENTGDFYPFQG